MFDGLTLIGEVNGILEVNSASGIVHGEAFEFLHETNISGFTRVRYTVCKSNQLAGSMSWSKSNRGIIQLFKKARGSNQFGIRPIEDACYLLSEKDDVQEVGRINVGSKDNLIWTGTVTSPQRPKEQAHELMLYCAFLLHKSLTV